MTERQIGRRIIQRDRVESTMDEVARLAERGEPEGTVVVANEQSAGRGRAGRTWEAAPGRSILCSVLLRPTFSPDRLPLLSLAAGVAIAEAVETTGGLSCRLKWPNDVWIDERKVAGVLVTARTAQTVEHAILGIGINVNVPASQLPAGATSLLERTGRSFDRFQLLGAVLAEFAVLYRALAAGDGTGTLAAWRARAALVGEPVTIEIGEVRRDGLMRGIDETGALLLDRSDGMVERIVAGDLTRGPVIAT